jgi:hypothetical protein
MRYCIHICVTLCFGLFLRPSQSCASGTDSACGILLQKAKADLGYSTFDQFLECYSAMDAEHQQKFLLDRTNMRSIQECHQALFLRAWDDTLLLIHSQIRKLLQADAEGGEQADARFSRHFIEKPDCSLSAIDHLHNRGVIRDIVRSASYLEGSADKIVNYMKANRLTKRKYYLLFLERSSFAKRSSRHWSSRMRD